MNTDRFSDEAIIDAWHDNATPWVVAVRSGAIASRRLVTDEAIVAAIVAQAPASALDVGCGEGWLARALSAKGIRVTGVDVVPALVECASAAGGGDFRVASYEDIAAGKLSLMVDAVVCNFSLIGEVSVDHLMTAVPTLLRPGGTLIVQTLHPLIACGEHVYRDGWREGSWVGFSDDFVRPAPWYFRTLANWIALFESSGLRVREIREPLHPDTGKPASIIFIASTV